MKRMAVVVSFTSLDNLLRSLDGQQRPLASGEGALETVIVRPELREVRLLYSGIGPECADHTEAAVGGEMRLLKRERDPVDGEPWWLGALVMACCPADKHNSHQHVRIDVDGFKSWYCCWDGKVRFWEKLKPDMPPEQ